MKHDIPATVWPTAAEAARSRLFQPIQVGAFSARHRTWVPAMVPWRATEEGFVTAEVLDWYARFAAGKPGVLVVEATGIRDVPSGPLLRIGHDRFLPGLRELVDVVRESSGGETRLLIQIIDFLTIRRRPERKKYFQRYLQLRDEHRRAVAKRLQPTLDDTGVRNALASFTDEALREILNQRELEALLMGYRERVSDTHLPHIAELPKVLPELFAAAAVRAREAGFDGVELHFAHAYTMASFLSRRNNRDDGYGRSRENRVRLPLEVLARVRARVGPDYTVGCRFLGDEVIEGGSQIEDAVYYGQKFARAGMDFLSVSKGGKFEDAKQPKVGEAAYPYTGPSGHECMPTVKIEGEPPFGRNLPLSQQIRTGVREVSDQVPIVGAGGMNSFELAETALKRGDCDIVAAARQSLADPDWFLKMRLGLGASIRRCVYTNYCEALDQKHREVTCQLWDRDPTEPRALAKDGRRRLIAPPWFPNS